MSGGPGWKLLGAVALGSAAVTAIVVTVAMRPADEATAGNQVRAYLLDNPEVIPEAMEKLHERETAKAIASNRKALETPFAGAWSGAKDGDVVLVQFFDYACGYCRASLPDVQRLVAADKRVKVVFRELPILSEASEDAARVSLAAAGLNRFGAFHDAMYAAGRPAEATIEAASRKAGLDSAAVTTATHSPPVEAELAGNVRLARALGISGTPAWVVGDKVLSGAVGYDRLKKAVDEARAGD
ncbi:DsbA family protein [Sphingomonas flavalba]|uniref:DsbA family protein n=1 Tax=Sphingomonas flavalba TaxID=2559804 RepID=UPI0039E18FFA